MAEIKTKVTKASVKDFINSVPNETRRQDGFTLLKLYEKITGQKARMWGPSMIGFDVYHYKSERSSQQGDWPMAAFSPRKQNLTLYVLTPLVDHSSLLKKLGKHKASDGACLYINKLEDVDMKVLEQIIKKSYLAMKKKYPKT
jgi:hypothetical protein